MYPILTQHIKERVKSMIKIETDRHYTQEDIISIKKTNYKYLIQKLHWVQEFMEEGYWDLKENLKTVNTSKEVINYLQITDLDS